MLSDLPVGLGSPCTIICLMLAAGYMLSGCQHETGSQKRSPDDGGFYYQPGQKGREIECRIVSITALSDWRSENAELYRRKCQVVAKAKSAERYTFNLIQYRYRKSLLNKDLYQGAKITITVDDNNKVIGYNQRLHSN